MAAVTSSPKPQKQQRDPRAGEERKEDADLPYEVLYPYPVPSKIEALMFDVTSVSAAIDALRAADSDCKALETSPAYAVVDVNFDNVGLRTIVSTFALLGCKRDAVLAKAVLCATKGAKRCMLLTVDCDNALYSLWVVRETAEHSHHTIASKLASDISSRISEVGAVRYAPFVTRALVTAAEQEQLDILDRVVPKCNDETISIVLATAAGKNRLGVCRCILKHTKVSLLLRHAHLTAALIRAKTKGHDQFVDIVGQVLNSSCRRAYFFHRNGSAVWFLILKRGTATVSRCCLS